jgi:hypothetical protein
MRTLAVLAACAGCNPGVFGDLEGDTWVDSTDRPGDLSSSGYGAALVFGGSGGSGASIAVAARTPAAVALLRYDRSGALGRAAALIHEVAVDGADNLPARPAMASDPAGFGDANVALGVSSGGRSWIVLVSGSSFEFATPIDLGPGGPASALAFGNTDAGTAGVERTDLVALVGDELVLIADYLGDREVHRCELAGGLDLAVVDAGSPDGAQIAVAVAGAVVLLTGTAVEAGVCEGTEINTGSADAAQRLFVADFDGDGAMDLAVSAPGENQVRVWLDLRSEPTEPVVLSGPSGSVSFGVAMAAGDLDGDGADELVVGDGGWSSEISGGGAAHIYRLAGGGFGSPVTLRDADPESNQRFGQALAIARWNDQDDILVVAADDEVFTYFQVPLEGSQDVRR